MKFCPQCRNMLYGIDEEVVDDVKTAILSCRKKECNYKEPIDASNPVVYERALRGVNTAALVMNPYLKYDPTLEHLTNVTCPNTECVTHTDKSIELDVVPVEIDSKKLLWMYQCAHCNQTWTQSSRMVDKNA